MLGLGRGVWRGKGRKGGAAQAADKVGGVEEFSKSPEHLEVKSSTLTVWRREPWSSCSALDRLRLRFCLSHCSTSIAYNGTLCNTHICSINSG